ncbi:hypothetical protein J2Y86_000910 [Pseudomonas migulae]|uniref:hypothetical protein n=1 Tax=Pseudomonas migulae TaxID=78543 RepID=UPI00209F83F3|nr:hypothetical protein [Pseudomonas migulae]MCP1496203.1 hypothetical protein [Pseudomonas migulae]
MDQQVEGMDSVSVIEKTQEMAVSIGNVLVVAGKKGDSGAAGVGVDEIFVNEAKNLIFKLTDGRQLSAGYLPAGAIGPQGGPGLPGRDGRDGANGKGIANISITDGQLIVALSDGATLPLGNVKGQDGANGSNGISVIGAGIQASGDLVFEMSDGSFLNAGPISGGGGGGSGFVAGQISQFVKDQEFPWLPCDGTLFEMNWYPALSGSEHLEKVPAGSIWYTNFQGSAIAPEQAWAAQLNTLLIETPGALNFLSPRSLALNTMSADMTTFTQRELSIFSNLSAYPAVSGDPSVGEFISGYAHSGTRHVFLSNKFGTYGDYKFEIAVTDDLVNFSRMVLLSTGSEDINSGSLYHDGAAFFAFLGGKVYTSADGLVWVLVTDAAPWAPFLYDIPNGISRTDSGKFCLSAGAQLFIANGLDKASLDNASISYIGLVATEKVFCIENKVYLTNLTRAAVHDFDLGYSQQITLPQVFASARQIGNSILLSTESGAVFKTSNFISFEPMQLLTDQNYSAAYKTVQFHPRSNGTLSLTNGSNNRELKLHSVVLNEMEKWRMPNIPAQSGAKSFIKVQ